MVGLEHGRHHVVLGPVVLVAGGVGEDFADGDFVAAGEAGNVFADRVVERELAFFLEQQNGRGGELLGDGADGVAHRRRGGTAGRVAVGRRRAAVGMGVDELAVLDDGNGGGGNAGLLENLRWRCDRCGLEGGVDGVDGLSLQGLRPRAAETAGEQKCKMPKNLRAVSSGCFFPSEARHENDH